MAVEQLILLAHFDVEIERTFFLEDLDVTGDPINCCLYSFAHWRGRATAAQQTGKRNARDQQHRKINAILRILLYSLIKRLHTPGRQNESQIGIVWIWKAHIITKRVLRKPVGAGFTNCAQGQFSRVRKAHGL